MYGVAKFELSDVEVVEDGPELFDVGDVGKRFEADFVAGGRGSLGGSILSVVPEVPAMDERRRAILLKARLKEIDHLGAACGWARWGGILR
jgi:hypothetical protein